LQKSRDIKINITAVRKRRSQCLKKGRRECRESGEAGAKKSAVRINCDTFLLQS
jgi:hypothetical protein